MQDIGNKVVEFRKKKRISQAELGEMLGISSQQVSNIERGAGTKLSTLQKLESLIGGLESKTGESKKEKPSEASLLEELERLKKQNAQLIENNTLLIQLLRDAGVQLGKRTDLEVIKGELHPDFFIRAFQVKIG